VALRVVATFVVIGIVVAALGIASLTNLIRGGFGLSTFMLVVALATFGIAGYFVWAYRWVQKHPDGNRSHR
jgi:hypothetical protein